MVPCSPCQCRPSGPGLHAASVLRFFRCLVSTVLISAHRPVAIHPCVGRHDKADAVHPPLFPCERRRLCQLQRYRKAAAVRGSGTWTHHHRVEVAGRYHIFFYVIFKIHKLFYFQLLKSAPSIKAKQADTWLSSSYSRTMKGNRKWFISFNKLKGTLFWIHSSS